ncbi:hypothetical protein Asppvi_006042 [Aspergillus pseudoviridinutans]|uniref:Uncharacterized protein n=1 Tax=Aspergillus pseudoviridinutans TaxID=1517512 RepID=A0A9P3BF27_9EURO|nr:uncharacterized protein Asppvi_006042 [Aspergillus pseudoviridinutans]GIJ87138.1 hypothetical protein Asppvi_006042 [Aspergillus pseudoviridinutans]
MQKLTEEDDIDLAAPLKIPRPGHPLSETGLSVGEARLSLDINEVFSWSTVVREFANVLTKATAEIQERFTCVNVREYFWVHRLKIGRKVEESEEADAGKWQAGEVTVSQTLPPGAGELTYPMPGPSRGGFDL